MLVYEYLVGCWVVGDIDVVDELVGVGVVVFEGFYVGVVEWFGEGGFVVVCIGDWCVCFGVLIVGD